MNSSLATRCAAAASAILLFALAQAVPASAQESGQFSFTAIEYVVSEGEGAIYDLTQIDSYRGAMVTVTRSGGIQGRVLVDCVVTNGTATNDVHFRLPNVPAAPAVTNTLVFDHFQGSTNLLFGIVDDGITNAARRFYLTLTNPRLAPEEQRPLEPPALGTRTDSTVRILDDDQGFNIERATFRVAESGPEIVIGVVLKIGGPPDATVSVDYSTADTNVVLQSGSDVATDGIDFTTTTGTLVFGPGEIRQTVTLPILDDDLVELSEDFRFFLLNVQADVAATNFVVVTNPDGTMTTNEEPTTVTYAALGQVTDATVTILGSGRSAQEQPAGAARPDWNRDLIFNPTPGANNTVAALRFQADGKALVGGDFTSFNGISRNRIARIEPDGMIDFTFFPGTGADGSVTAIDLYEGGLEEGKVVVGGGFTSINNIQRNSIARLHPDGSLDWDFDPGLGADGPVYSILVQPDDRVLIGGAFQFVDGTPRSGIARLNRDGSLDTTFDPGTGADGAVWALALQKDRYTPEEGYILVGGDFLYFDGRFRSGITQLNAGGGVVESFRPGSGTDGPVYAIQYLPQPTVAVAAISPTNGPTAHTNLVATGAPQGYVQLEFVSPGATNNLRIYYENFLLIDTNLTGTGVVSVAYGPGQTNEISLLVNETNNSAAAWSYSGFVNGWRADRGKILIAGGFTHVEGVSRGRLARLNSTGTVDPTFDPPWGVDNTVYAMTVMPDERIVLGGAFAKVNGTARSAVARVFPDGSLDTSFLDTLHNHYAGLAEPDGFVTSLAPQADGAILIGGSFHRIGGGGERRSTLVRHNVALLQGGETPGPGNVRFVTTLFSYDENAPQARVSVMRENGAAGAVKAEAETLDGSARAGEDFVGATSEMLWADGEIAWQDLRLDLLDDFQPEQNETFEVRLTQLSGGKDAGGDFILTGPALGKTWRSSVMLIDNDFQAGTIGFSAPRFTVDENAATAQITVVRTNGSTGSVVVDYVVREASTNSATAGVDFMTRSGTLSFASGQASRTFSVAIIDDPFVEFDELIELELSNPRGGATLGETRALLRIIDNDFAPGRISFADPEYRASEADGEVWLTVERLGGNLGAFEVDYATRPGSALEGEDFLATGGRLVWADRDTSTRAIRIPILDDERVEGVELFRVALMNPSVSGGLGALDEASVMITDDDAYGLMEFTGTAYRADENGGAARVTVRRTGGRAGSVSVRLTTYEDTARDGLDYSGVDVRLEFLPGQMSAWVEIPIQDDALAEGEETVLLRLSDPALGELGAVTDAVLTLVDNEVSNVPAGGLDTSYNPSMGVSGIVHALSALPDGSLVVGGDFTAVNDAPRSRLARLDPGGVLDSKFASTGGANGVVWTLAVQNDAKILIGGAFDRVHGVNRSRLARLNADGSLDQSFNPGSGANNPVFAVAETFQGDQRRIFIGGGFSAVNGQTRWNLAQLQDDGALDPRFNPEAYADGTIYAATVQEDGKLLIGGDFTTVNGAARARVARLHPNGALDLSFNPGLGPDGSVRALAVDRDGRVVIGGLFQSVSGVQRGFIARLEFNGTLDAMFDPGTGSDGAVYAIALQEDGRILAAGEFGIFNGVTRNRITRLRPDGSNDPTINFGLGANAPITCLDIQSDGKIVMGGGFTLFNGATRRGIARLHGGAVQGAGQLEFSAPVFRVAENGTNATLIVRRTGGTAGTVAVMATTLGGTATAGIDYEAGPVALEFPEGETVRGIVTPILDDSQLEEDETVLVELSIPTGGASLGLQPRTTLVIENDDSLIEFGAGTYSVNENAVGGRGFVEVVRRGAVQSAASVLYTVTGGTATGGTDFVAGTGLVQFAAGERSKLVAVGIIDDLEVEANETVEIALANPSAGVELGRSRTSLIIVENDFAPGRLQFGAAQFAVSEDAGTARITIVRTNGSSGVVSVLVHLGGGTATPDTDYWRPGTLVAFADGEMIRTLSIPIVNDTLSEGNETVLLTLSNPNGGAFLGSPASSVLTIFDDEAAIGLEQAEYRLWERAGTLQVRVLRSGNLAAAVSVDYATFDGSAGAGVDYEARFGTLVFAPGENEALFTVPLLDDFEPEAVESFGIELSNVQGSADLGRARALVFIDDDDIPPVRLGFASASYTVVEDEANAVLSVVRTGDTNLLVLVNYGTVDGTALDGEDYNMVSGMLTFGPGETNKVLFIPLRDDLVWESDEDFEVRLSGIIGAAPGRTRVTVTILDNESDLLFSTNLFTVDEGGTNAVITVLRTNGVAGVISADYQAWAGTTNPATAGVDFIMTTGRLTLTNGQVSATVVIPILDDFLIETNESISLTLFNVAGGSLLEPSHADLLILDNDSDNGGFTIVSPEPVRGSELGGLLPVTVARSGGSSGNVSVELIATTFGLGSACDGTTNALIGIDLQPAVGSLSWTNGEAGPKVFNFTIVNDTEPELVESLWIELANPSGGAVLNANRHTALAVITSEDQAAGAADYGYNGAPFSMDAPGANGMVYAVAVYTNGLHAGKALVAGDFTAINATVRNGIARLNPDGSVDPGFQPGADAFVFALAVQEDGRIVVGGGFSSIANFSRSRVARLNEDGTLDPSFHPGTGADGPVYSILLEPNGRMIIGGDFTTFNGIERNGIARLLPNGALDLSFDPGSGADGPVFALAAAGQQLFTAAATNFGTGPAESRTNVNTGSSAGTVDVTYDFGASDDTLRIYYGPVLVFDSGPTNNAVLITNVDNTVTTNTLPRMVTVPYGPGAFTDVTLVINEGSTSIGTDWAYRALLRPAEISGLLVGGDFVRFDGVERLRLVRLNPGGRIDPSFDPGAGADGPVHALHVFADGSLAVAGDFRSFDGVLQGGLARVLGDGRIDRAFKSGEGFDGVVFALAGYADGRLLAGGAFTRFNGTRRANVARLQPDGTLDTSFLDPYFIQARPGTDGFVGAVALQQVDSVFVLTNAVVANGLTNLVVSTNVVAGEKILLGGGFQRIGGGLSLTDVLPRSHLGRLIGGSSAAPGNFELESATYSVDENSLSGGVTLTVRRQNGALGSAAVDYATSDETALAGQHYIGTSGTLTWTNCDAAAKSFTIPILDNSAVEGNRTFQVRLSNPRGLREYAMAEPALGFLTETSVLIVENDFNHGELAFAESEFSVAENQLSAVINVHRLRGSTGAASVRYTTTEGSAVAGQDYVERAGTLFFASGQTNRSFVISLLDDTTIEPDETIHLELTDPTGGALLGARSNAVLVVIDNDFAPGRVQFERAEFEALESDPTARITVRREGGTTGRLAVQFAAEDATAHIPQDYTEAFGDLVWSDGESGAKDFFVPLADDGFAEGDEIVLLRLFNPSLPGALGRRSEALLHIRDNDFRGELELSADTLWADESGGALTVIVQRRNGTAEPAAVRYSTLSGSAVPGTDYADVAGQLQFGHGQSSASFSIPILDDSVADGEKQFEIRLDSAAGASLGERVVARVRIVDDESVFQPAGRLDPEFRIGDGPNGPISAIALQADGKLVIAGEFREFDRTARNGLARLMPEGRLDPMFERTAGTDGLIYDLEVQEDGRLLLGGRFDQANGAPARNLGRLGRNGALDPSFNPGQGPDLAVYALDGRADAERAHILIGGGFSAFNTSIRRGLAVLGLDGVFDTAFNPGVGVVGTVYDLALLDDGRVLAAGDFSLVNGVPRRSIARFQADGKLDLTFNAGPGADGAIRSIAVQSDGRIVIGGLFQNVADQPRAGIARLETHGGIDGTFTPGAGANGPVYTVALQIDGRIVVAGDFTQFRGASHGRIVRLTSDGNVDPTINFGQGANAVVTSLAIQPDNKLLIGGEFTEFAGHPRRHLARLFGGASTGSGKVQFREAEIVVSETASIALLSVIRVGGLAGAVSVEFATAQGTGQPGLDYQETTGSVQFQEGETSQWISIPIEDDALAEADETFTVTLTDPDGQGRIGHQPIVTVRIRSDDTVLSFAEPVFSVSENPLGQQAVVRVVQQGTAQNPVTVNYSATAGTATAGQDFLSVSGVLTFAAGQTEQSFFIPILDDVLVEETESIMLRLSNATGSGQLGLASAEVQIVDNDFAPGVLSLAGPADVSEGGVLNVAVRRSSGQTGSVGVRYTTEDGTARAGEDYVPATGTLSFSDGDTIKGISIPLLDDSVVEGNETIQIRLTSPTGGAILGFPAQITVTLVDDDFGPGSVDDSFNPGTGANGAIRAMLLQPDGRILVGGDFNQLNGQFRNRLGRLRGDGSVDPDFSAGAGPDGNIFSIVEGAPGQLLVGGPFRNFGAGLRPYTARLNSSGFLDGSFNRTAGLNGAVWTVAQAAGGKVVAGGAFTTPAAGIVRLNQDGTLDVGFDPEGGVNGTVRQVLVEPGNTVVIAGDFLAVGRTARGRLARLLPHGLPDAQFAAGSGANGPIHAVLRQADGRLFIAGDFTVYDGFTCRRVARLNNDGTYDPTFQAGPGADGPVYALSLQPDGKLLLAGDFATVGNVSRVRVARLHRDGTLDTEFAVTPGPNGPVYAVAAQPDGPVLIAGDFTTVNGLARNRIARLDGGPLDTLGTIQIGRARWTSTGALSLSFNSVPGYLYQIEISEDLNTWETQALVRADGATLDYEDRNSGASEMRYYRVRAAAP